MSAKKAKQINEQIKRATQNIENIQEANQQACKPPIGIMPEHIWTEQRMYDLVGAIQRYREAGMTVPQDWLNELGLRIDEVIEWHMTTNQSS